MLLQIKPARTGVGSICIAIYDSKATFMKEEQGVFAKCYQLGESDRLDVRVPALDFGTYAIAVIQDLDNDGQLDKNVFGIPKEPYGFSNNPKVKWKPPQFEDAQINFGQAKQNVAITLRFWADF